MRPSRYALMAFSMFVVACQESSGPVPATEREKIKNELIESYKNHIEDLKRLDYEALMPYYIKDEHVIFGDGKYWGDYETSNQIWKQFCLEDVDTIIKWDLSNHKVYLFSRDAASYLVEFDNVRVQKGAGDTIKSTGCFSYGMQRIEGAWKIATINVTHNYTQAPWIKK